MFPELKNSRQRSIQSFSEDKLNRRYFVNYVTNIIKNAPVEDKAFTVAINGKWGEGKTSVKNLIIERFFYNKKTSNNILLEFNSHNFQNYKDLNKFFLNNVVNVIKGKNKERGLIFFLVENRKLLFLITLITLLAISIIYPNIIIRFFSLLLSFLFIFKTQLKKVTLSVLMDVAAKSYIKVDVVHRILYYNEIKDDDIPKLKLKKYLENKCPYNRIIVFVDSFDMLEPSQIKLLMQFINDNSCLQKFIFVLFYDKNIVSNSLTTNLYKGSDFIENVVNIQLDLPPITDDILSRFLQNELQEKYNIDIAFYNTFKYIKCYFTSLNKIYSFLDNFSVNYTLAVKSLTINNFVFNKKDFFFLEVLRFFENDLYREIRLNKRLLTKNDLKINVDYTTVWPRLSKLIKNNSEENIKNLLIDIFPYLTKELDLDYNYDNDYLVNSGSVGYFDYFDYYFVYDLNGNVIGESNFVTLCGYLNNYKQFVTNFNKILIENSESSIYKTTESFLFKLHNRIDSIDLKNLFSKDFLKNIIWLYVYSSIYKTSRKYIIKIVSECLKTNSLDNIIDTLCSILDEKDYFNYFYIIEILVFIKSSIYNIIKDKDVIDIENYKKNIDDIIFKYSSDIMENDEFLKYLIKDQLDSKLQIKNISNFIMEKISIQKDNSFLSDTIINNYIKSDNFKKFKENIFNNYFNLLYLFCEYRISRKIINSKLISYITEDSLYPLDINDIIIAFRKNNINKKDKVFSMLLLAKNMSKKSKNKK